MDESKAQREALIEAERTKVHNRRRKRKKRADETSGGERSKKRKKRREEEEETGSVKEEDDQPTTITYLTIPASTPLKFDWLGAILDILRKKGGRIKVNKLKKKVLSSYPRQIDSGSKTDSELEAKFHKKLRRCKKVKMEKEYVLLVDGGADSLVPDTSVKCTAVPLVKQEPREDCSTKAVKVEPPCPIPEPSSPGTVSPPADVVIPPMSPVHQRSFSITRCRSPSPTPPSTPTRPNSADSVDDKRRFVDQWIHGFGESIAEPETEGSKQSKDTLSLKT